ncbi:MAG TPA: hypothetical protein VEJ47_00095 [Candidatus Eremiobacteraceae bacterium]|nr:hypothetical protein [Candidatus Eremiobacteraceae bacterium]
MKKTFHIRIPHPNPEYERVFRADCVLEYLFEHYLPMMVSNYIAYNWMFDGGSQMLLRDLGPEHLADVLELVAKGWLTVDRAEDQAYLREIDE